MDGSGLETVEDGFSREVMPSLAWLWITGDNQVTCGTLESDAKKGKLGYTCIDEGGRCDVEEPFRLAGGVCNAGEYNTAECYYDAGDCEGAELSSR